MPPPKGKPKPKSKPAPTKAAAGRGKKSKKPPPFSVKQYLIDSVTGISNFFTFVFASDYTPRQNELVDASITFLHYN